MHQSHWYIYYSTHAGCIVVVVDLNLFVGQWSRAAENSRPPSNHAAAWRYVATRWWLHGGLQEVVRVGGSDSSAKPSREALYPTFMALNRFAHSAEKCGTLQQLTSVHVVNERQCSISSAVVHGPSWKVVSITIRLMTLVFNSWQHN